MDDTDRRRLVVGLSVSAAVHVVAALVIVLMPATPSRSPSNSTLTASPNPAQARGFPGDTTSRITNEPRRPAPRGSLDARAPQDSQDQLRQSGVSSELAEGQAVAADQNPSRDLGGQSASGGRGLGEPSASGTPDSTVIVGSVVDPAGRFVAGVRIAYLTASGRRTAAEARYGDRSNAAVTRNIPPPRRRILVDWLTRIDPQETYSGGVAGGITGSNGSFAILVSEPDVYVVTAQRTSPPQIGSLQPVIVNAERQINLPRPIRLTVGWSPEASRQNERVRARDLADDDPRVRSWGPQQESFRQSNPIVLSWQEAQEALLLNDVRGGKDYQSGWLTILTRTERYLTKPPDEGAFRRFAREYSIPLDGFASE